MASPAMCGPNLLGPCLPQPQAPAREALAQPSPAANAPRIAGLGRPQPRGERLVARVAGSVDAASASAAAEGSYASWPSEACRAAAFGTTQLEEARDVAATVTGRLPAWLKGAYLRNGPGSYDNGGGGMVHLFDGFALLVKLELDGATNTATGSHRFLESEAYTTFKSTGRQRWREFGTPPPVDGALGRLADAASTILGSMGLSQGVTDNASVNLIPSPDGSVVAMTETVQGTYSVDPATLATLGQVRYGNDGIRGDLTTAHPTRLPGGDLINIVSTVGTGFQVYRQAAGAGPGGPRTRLATVPHRRPLAPTWVHDFPVTPAHAVIPDTPIYFNLGALVAGGSTEHIFMDWVPEDGAVLHVVPLGGAGGPVRSFRAPAFFCFHWVNAFESQDGRYLHLDAAVYADPTICNDLYLASAKRGPPARGAADAGVSRSYYRRLTLDLHAPDGSEVGPWEALVADEEEAYGAFFDFPAVAPGSKGRAYRYAWGACATRPTNAGNSLVKFDNQERSCKVWHEAGILAGEPVFVAAPGAAAEDEGVVMAMVVQADGAAAMVFLDGQSHEEVARAVLPYALSNGFHGGFIPAAR